MQDIDQFEYADPTGTEELRAKANLSGGITLTAREQNEIVEVELDQEATRRLRDYLNEHFLRFTLLG